MQGHHLFNNVVVPTMQSVCDELRREREQEIRQKAVHVIQMQNELSAYTHSVSDLPQMLKKNQGYTRSVPYKKLQDDINNFLNIENEKITTNPNNDVSPDSVGKDLLCEA